MNIIKWEHRMGDKYNDSREQSPEEIAMQAEIDELRAALASQATPVAYADPQAFINFNADRKAGDIGKEFMWSTPDTGLVPLYTGPQPAFDKEKALQQFTDYFVRNYPGPDTIITNPGWHAPRIFNAALNAILKKG